MTSKKEKHSVEEEVINELTEEENSVDQTEADSQSEAPKQSNKQDIEALKAENAKLKDAFLRAYAEAENIKKRCLGIFVILYFSVRIEAISDKGSHERIDQQ